MSNWWKAIHSTPKAIAEYTSIAKRKTKAAGLPIKKISDSQWIVNGWKVTGNAKTCWNSGNNLKCECPDHTAKDKFRDWSWSNAGKFNPCKHIYKVLMSEQTENKRKAKVTLPDGRIFIYEDTPVQIDCFLKWGENCEQLILRLNDGQNTPINDGWNFSSKPIWGPIYNWEFTEGILKVLCRGSAEGGYGCQELKFHGISGMWWTPVPGMQKIVRVSDGSQLSPTGNMKIYGASGNILFEENVSSCGYSVECIL